MISNGPTTSASWPTRSSIHALAVLAASVLFLALGAGVAQAAPTTFIVTNTNDSDDGSLRKAITDANSNSNPAEQDTIEFDIPGSDPGCDAGSGVCTISPGSVLPEITEPVNIDGYSQTDASANTLSEGNDAALKIELNGASAGEETSGVKIVGSNSLVKGLIVNRWTLGVEVVGSDASGNTIEGNYIGTDADGTTSLGNIVGVLVENATDNVVGGTSAAARNIISGNDGDGVSVSGSGASGNSVQGNYIGTDASGQGDLGNLSSGVTLTNAPNNVVGGTTAIARNIISGNNNNGVLVLGSDASDNAIQGNYVGTDTSGQGDLGNSNYGVHVVQSPGNVVGGTLAAARNVISGNDNSGVFLESGSTGNAIQGNYVGTDSAGTADLGNTFGVRIEASQDNAVGGTDAGARNIISGNNNNGVLVLGSDASGNEIQGNYIGTDKNGTADLGNGGGVSINGSPGNVVGGTSVAARNIVSGNGFAVLVLEPSASGNSIQGNYIGTDVSGTEALGNNDGVLINDAPNNVVGGTTAGARNIISGSGNGSGVLVINAGASGNTIQGNYIGTDKNGTADVGNSGHGVRIVGASNNTVGGTVVAAGNLISENGGDGVFVSDFSDLGFGATGNRILINSISNNGGLGIELIDSTQEDPSGVTANDLQDPDTGPNNLQNFPTITSASAPTGQATTIQGTLNSTPNGSFNVQLFSSPTPDPSGFGEGKTYLGQTNVTANAGGNATFTFTTNKPIVGQVVTATATNRVTKDTSEFSETVEVQDNTKPTIVSTNPQDGATGVVPGINVSATFSEQMKASTINNTTFKLFKKVGATNQRVPAVVTYSAGQKRATLNPNANLTLGATYLAQVTTGAQDVAGNGLAARKDITFTVRP